MNVFERYAPFIQDYIYRSGWQCLRGVQNAAGEAIFNTDQASFLIDGHGLKTVVESFKLSKQQTGALKVDDAGNVMLVPRGDKQKDVCLTEQGKELAELTLGTLLDAEDQIALRCASDELIAGLEVLADEMEGAIGGACRKKA